VTIALLAAGAVLSYVTLRPRRDPAEPLLADSSAALGDLVPEMAEVPALRRESGRAEGR
jgi:hypothetical protein